MITHQGLEYDEEYYQLKYFETGHVTHLVGPGGDYGKSACGMQPHFMFWWGTGSQAEIDKAKELPLCKSCRRRLGETKHG